MFDRLSVFLESRVTPEQKHACLTACRVLSDAGIQSHVDAIERELAMEDQIESDAVLVMVHRILMPLLREAIGEFGVVLTEETTLSQASDVLNALCWIDNYEDVDTLNGLSMAPEGPEAALADILGLMGSLSVGEYMQVIQSVNPDLLDRVEQISRRDAPPEDEPDQALVERCQLRLNRLVATAQLTQPLLVQQALADGVRLGTSLSLLTAPYLTALEELPAGQLALELTGFALASSTPDAQLRQAVSGLLEIIHTDFNKVTAVDVAVTKHLDLTAHA